MHADEVRIDSATLRGLLRRQAPAWADLEIRPLPRRLEGTDHTLFRIGDRLLARMPKIGWASDQAVSDATWLPRLAPQLTVSLPVPVHVGEPDDGYPFAWSVTQWLPGANPRDRGDVGLAEQLATFVTVLHRVPVEGGPLPADGARGTPLAAQDDRAQETLRALSAFDDGFDVRSAARAWDRCASAPATGARVWIHGDLNAGNLLVADGRLGAVIDWGAIGVADPAPDLSAAYWLFDGPARRRYRELLPHDEAAWLRAAGWALLPALTGLDYYRRTAPDLAARGRREIRAVIAELEVG